MTLEGSRAGMEVVAPNPARMARMRQLSVMADAVRMTTVPTAIAETRKHAAR